LLLLHARLLAALLPHFLARLLHLPRPVPLLLRRMLIWMMGKKCRRMMVLATSMLR
jgi:hypothetical protein